MHPQPSSLTTLASFVLALVWLVLERAIMDLSATLPHPVISFHRRLPIVAPWSEPTSYHLLSHSCLELYYQRTDTMRSKFKDEHSFGTYISKERGLPVSSHDPPYCACPGSCGHLSFPFLSFQVQ